MSLERGCWIGRLLRSVGIAASQGLISTFSTDLVATFLLASASVDWLPFAFSLHPPSFLQASQPFDACCSHTPADTDLCARTRATFATRLSFVPSTFAVTMSAPVAPPQATAYPPGVQAPPPSGAERVGPGAPSPFVDEKRAAYPSGLTPPISSQPSTSMFGFFQPIVAPLNNALATIQDIRTRLELSNPGTVEHLQREVKGVHTTNFMFDGARADLTKAISINPIFQVTHAFSMGSQAAPSSYNFGAVYGDNNNFFQAGLDDGLNVTMRANRGWVPGHTTKVQAQLTATPGQSFVQVEHDYQGTDHSANLKALNPSPTDLTGIYIVNYLQSLTRNFAFGVETVYQRPSADMEEASTGYIAKLTGDKKEWIATAQVQPQGVAQCTYFHKLSEQVDVAADLQVVSMGQKRESAATLGARYNFRMATLRAQIDSAGKLSSVYETRLSPAFGLTFAGEIDHLQGAAKFGFGVSIESGNEMDPNAPPPTPPSVPM